MYTKNYSLRKLILIVVVSVVSFTAYGQIKLQNRTLAFLQSIAFESTYDNIVPMFEAMNLTCVKEVNGDKTESIFVDVSEWNKIHLLYNASKKLIFAQMRYRAGEKIFSANEMYTVLEEAGFRSKKVDKTDMFKLDYTYYHKDGYPFEFIFGTAAFSLFTLYIFNKEIASFDKYKDE